MCVCVYIHLSKKSQLFSSIFDPRARKKRINVGEKCTVSRKFALLFVRSVQVF